MTGPPPPTLPSAILKFRNCILDYSAPSSSRIALLDSPFANLWAYMSASSEEIQTFKFSVFRDHVATTLIHSIHPLTLSTTDIRNMCNPVLVYFRPQGALYAYTIQLYLPPKGTNRYNAEELSAGTTSFFHSMYCFQRLDADASRSTPTIHANATIQMPCAQTPNSFSAFEVQLF